MSTEAQAMAQQAHLDDPKSSVDVFELPCGYLTPDKELWRHVKLREIDGECEDILANPRTPPVLKMGELLARCVQRIGACTDEGRIAGEIVPKLALGDRVFLLIAARRVTLGDRYLFEQTCKNPNCFDMIDGRPVPTKSQYEIDLGNLEIKPMPNPMVRNYTAQISSRDAEGKLVTVPMAWHVMTGEDDVKIARFAGEHIVSLQILARLDEWAGKTMTLRPDGSNALELLMWAKSLSMRTRNALRDAFEASEGGVDTGIELTCPRCQKDFSTELSIDAGFFRPSQVSKGSKRK